MNKNVLLLSVVIPTRNRLEYITSTIRGILSIPGDEFELIIQDSSDSNVLETHIKTEINDSRLFYNYTSPPFSAIDNFNAATHLAKGEYVCFIGDDDGVNRKIIDIIRWAKLNNVDALRSPLIANYYWPDIQKYDSLENFAGKLFIQKFSGKITFSDVEKEMLRVVHNAGQGYLQTNLPKVYHGIVRKKCLDEVYNLTGAYFKGLSPDIFGALTVSNFVKRAVSIDYPLTIGGTSAVSGAGESSAGKHKGKLEDAPHFRDRGKYGWPDTIPKFYSVQTIWAESTIVALTEINRPDLLKQFNNPLLYALCIVSHPDFYNIVLHDMYRTIRKQDKNLFMEIIKFCYCLITSQSLRAAKYIVRRIRSIFISTTQEIGGVNDIQEAMCLLDKHLGTCQHKLNILDVIQKHTLDKSINTSKKNT